MAQNNHRPQGQQHTKNRRRKKQNKFPAALLGIFTAFFAVSFCLLIFGDKFLNSHGREFVSSSHSTQENSNISANSKDEPESQTDIVTPTSDPTAEPMDKPTTEPMPEKTPISTQTPAPTPKSISVGANMVYVEDMLSDPYMLLVNVKNPVSESFEVETKIVNAELGRGLEPTAANAFLKMQVEAKNAGLTLLAQSGYRSVSYQTNLFKNKTQHYLNQGHAQEQAEKLAATVVAIPGTSEHHTGLAVDINTPNHMSLTEGFENTAEFAWLSENAHKYGFILRFPKEDQDTTGIIYEPWHWRYVGVPNAEIIRDTGLCFEDFYAQYLGE